MKLKPSTLAATTALALLGATAQASALEGVVASIKPIHSLVAGVMEGVGEPSLLVQGAGSPHTYTLRPSEAAALESASVVFWVGEGLETFLTGPLETLAANARVVELGEAHGLTLLAYREGGPFEAHAHDDHDGHDHGGHSHGHDDHDHDAHDHAAHDHDEGHGHDHAEEAHAHDDHTHNHDHSHDAAAHDHEGDDHAGHDHAAHDHAHGEHDMHVWLDPENAKAIVHEIEEALSEADPENAGRYAENARALQARLDTLIEETRTELAAIDGAQFVVFHDAYQYYEARFALAAAGSITVNPDTMPGAQRLSEIRDRVRELGVSCVFAEPQFEPRLVEVVTEGTEARSGVLDPLGADIADGPELYFELIGNMTTSFTSCLSAAG